MIVYLSEHVGKNVVLNLSDAAGEDRLIRTFLETDGFVIGEIVAVDELGVWLKGTYRRKFLKNEDGTIRPNPTFEKAEADVLIRWAVIQSAFVPADGHIDEKTIGFLNEQA